MFWNACKILNVPELHDLQNGQNTVYLTSGYNTTVMFFASKNKTLSVLATPLKHLKDCAVLFNVVFSQIDLTKTTIEQFL